MLEVNGKKYSKESFEDYGFRAKVVITTTVNEEFQFDIYTTDSSEESVRDVLLDRTSNNVVSVVITYQCSREQDDASAAMIDEWLNKD